MTKKQYDRIEEIAHTHDAHSCEKKDCKLCEEYHTLIRIYKRNRVKGDWCPIGPLQLHHWDQMICNFCGGTR